MKKICLTITAIAAIFVAHSQMLTPEVIAGTGAYSVNNSANASLSYTVGEMTMVQTLSGNGNILTQGFQQPTDKIANGIIEITQDAFGSFVVYPNPAIDNVWFGLKLPAEGKVNVAMYNEIGQNIEDVYNSNYQSGNVVQQTNISTLAAGVYIMTMTFVSTVDNQTHILTKKFQVVN